MHVDLSQYTLKQTQDSSCDGCSFDKCDEDGNLIPCPASELVDESCMSSKVVWIKKENEHGVQEQA